MTCSSSAMVAGRAVRSVAFLLAMAVAACAAPRPDASASVPPKEALALNDAVDAMTVALFARAQLDPAAPRTVVVDPLVDRNTGAQSAVTRAMEGRMASTMGARFPHMSYGAFTEKNLAGRPLVLVGAITPVAGPGVIPTTTAPTQTYRIWASIADLRTGRIVAHETAWVRADQVDMTPAPFFADSPAWAPDRSHAAYIRTCAGNPGDPADPAYLSGLTVAASVSEGIKAYEAGQYDEALNLYTQAAAAPGGDQMRVFNGIYLANARLNRPAAAEEAFGRMVGFGLDEGKLAVKFVFRPGSTQFWPDRQVSGPYPVWLRQIALRTAERPTCLRLIGHTSPTGAAPLNDRLSLARAEAVRGQLNRRAPVLTRRTESIGRGSAEPLVGSGRDDATDVLDRRVEFEPRDCATTVAGMRQAAR